MNCAEAYSCAPHKRFRQTCHVFSVIDTEIAGKGHLWTETILITCQYGKKRMNPQPKNQIVTRTLARTNRPAHQPLEQGRERSSAT